MNDVLHEGGERRWNMEPLRHRGQGPSKRFSTGCTRSIPAVMELPCLTRGREPTIYLIPECATDEELVDVLRELREELRGATDRLVSG